MNNILASIIALENLSYWFRGFLIWFFVPQFPGTPFSLIRIGTWDFRGNGFTLRKLEEDGWKLGLK